MKNLTQTSKKVIAWVRYRLFNIKLKICLKNLEWLTEQEIFNYVLAHAREQNKCSGNEYGFTLYHSPEGLKSFAGCLISDREYKPEIEICSWSFVIKILSAPIAHLEFIEHLEGVHDNFEIHKWEEQFQEIARERNLVYK